MWNQDEAYLAGRARTIQKMLQLCEWSSLEELVVCVDQPNARDLVTSWEEDRQIFSIPTERGARYPRFQFDAAMKPLRVIKVILAELGNQDPMATASWFVFKNDWITRPIDGKSETVPPMFALQDPHGVLLAARHESGTYIA